MTKEGLINKIKEYLNSDMYKYESCYLGKEDLKLILKALEQEPTTGHWVNDDDTIGCYYCSECGGYVASCDDAYCKYCGSKM